MSEVGLFSVDHYSHGGRSPGLSCEIREKAFSGLSWNAEYMGERTRTIMGYCEVDHIPEQTENV